MTAERKKIFLLNDTYLNNRHFGCEMVSSTFREQFARTNLEMIGSAAKDFDPAKYRAKMDAADLIVINGEGSIHHNRSRNLLEIAASYPTVLVNAVFEENSETAHLLKNFLLISCRESLSAEYVRSFGFETEVNPDVIFASAFIRADTMDEPQHNLGLTDSVRWRKSHFGPFKQKRKYGFPAECSVVDYLKTFTSYRHLCIGRFHGVVLASILKIPFSSWESNTWKTRGLMKDMGVEHLHFSTQEEAIHHVPAVFPESIHHFASEAPMRIEAMFDRISAIARR